MQGNIYSNFLLKIVNGEINWTTSPIKCVFCNNNYNPDKNFHKTLSDVIGIIEGFDLNISNRDIVLDNDCIYFKGDNIVLDNVNIENLKYIILYADTVDKLLICYIDVEYPRTVNDGILRLIWPDGNILKLSIG